MCKIINVMRVGMYRFPTFTSFILSIVLTVELSYFNGLCQFFTDLNINKLFMLISIVKISLSHRNTYFLSTHSVVTVIGGPLLGAFSLRLISRYNKLFSILVLQRYIMKSYS